MKQIIGTVFIAGIAAVLLLMASNALADEIKSFYLVTTNNALNNPIDATGTITIDTTTGVIDAIDLGWAAEDPAAVYSIGTDFGAVDPPTNNYIYFQEQWCGGPAPACLGFIAINIVIPDVSLVGYDGGLICSTDNPCFNADSQISGYTEGIGGGVYTSGELVATPEPSSLLLLVTGALFMGAALTRMKAKAVRTTGSRRVWTSARDHIRSCAGESLLRGVVP